MANIGNVGRLITKRSRGKMATTIKDGGTTIQAARGKQVHSEKKPRIISGSSSAFDGAFADELKAKSKKIIKRRGKTAAVLKQVRSN